jgi:putative transposase
VAQLAEQEGVSGACRLLAVSRSRYYRACRPHLPATSTAAVEPVDAATNQQPPSKTARALCPAEKSKVRDVLNSAAYQDRSPRQVYAALLDQGEYLCSWRTMYRILHEHAEVKERRNQLRRPVYRRPELLATGPNQLWTWDITKLRGPVKWQYYYLYVMLDVYSRCVVGWLLAECESAHLAQELMATCYARHEIEPWQLTIHADNGSAMQAKSVALLLADLRVVKSHSRPGVSNDNPFSEAQFKTLKYAPGYPDRFGSLADARQWAQAFFTWYNHEHHHTGIGLFTPADVHTGRAEELWHKRQAVMQQAYAAHPERFVKGLPHPPALPIVVNSSNNPSSSSLIVT